jgi:tRNA(Arg) A34 adenosine deaminase TadA
MTVHSSSLDHDAFMQRALELARENPKAPFGCVLVDQPTGKEVATGINQSSRNPTMHGEIAAINDYARRPDNAWGQLTLYTTAEPCCMCQGAILWSGIREVVFGTSIAELMALGWRQIDLPAQEVVNRSWDRGVIIVPGVRAAESTQLFVAAKS